jgi:Protein of unknown function (DUF3352)
VNGRLARLISLLLPAAAVLAGCGGGGGTTASFTGPDPAAMTPANAPFFGEVVVRPQGDQKEALQDALSKLLATDDPGGFFIRQLNSELAVPGSDKGLSYDDIEPWLGQRAGLFLTSFKKDEEGASVAQGAGLVATTDPAATQRAIDKAEAADPTDDRKRTYKGFDYALDRNGQAAGIVGDFLVVGDEQGFKKAVDASEGDSLADSAGFKTQLDQAPDDQFGFLYANPRGLVDALEKVGELTAGQVRAAGPQVQALLGQPVAASVSATSDQLALQASVAASAAASSQESSLLRDFPEDAWVAFAASDAGQTYGRVLDQIQAGTGSGQPLGGLGFDLGGQITRWAGDVGGFVGGTSLFGLSGALVLATNDEQASAHTLDQLQRALEGDPALSIQPLTEHGERGFSLTLAAAPIQFQVVQRDGKVVAGLADSVNDVFSPSSTLGDSDAFNSATDALGEDFAPVTFIDFGPLFQLVDGFPQAQSDPGYQSAKPYLDHLDYFVLGARRDQDRAEVRLALGLKDAPAQAGDSGAASAAVVAK